MSAARGPVARRALVAAALACACASATADGTLEVSRWPLRPAAPPVDTFMGVALRGSLVIERGRIDGLDVVELSGLAWDADDALLYALSDRGYLFHLRPIITGGVLSGLDGIAAHRLQDRRGRRLRGAAADAEGLAIEGGRNGQRGDARLFVSFERQPRVVAYTPRGEPVATHELPAPLRDAGAYASPNKSLEALALHPRVGLITAPEWPLGDGRAGRVAIRGLAGGVWHHVPYRTLNAAVVAIEALPDGSLVVLERGHGLLMLPVVIALRRTGVLAAGGGALAVRDLAVFDTSRGWSVDNFEGLTRHEGMRFFIVSDDNGRALQRTLLVYFEIHDTDIPADVDVVQQTGG